MAAIAGPRALTHGGPENDERRLACAAQPGSTRPHELAARLDCPPRPANPNHEPANPNHDPTKPTGRSGGQPASLALASLALASLALSSLALSSP